MKDEFIELYTGIYKDLYRYALYILCNKEDAEDAVSEAVVDAYAEFDKLRDKAAFRSWIFKILSIKCKRKIRGYVNRDDELDETVDAKERCSRRRRILQVKLICGMPLQGWMKGNGRYLRCRL